MTMGSGKTFTACNFIYRLIAYAGARRVLFLVDRRTLGRQALNEFQQFTIPGDGRKFTAYNPRIVVTVDMIATGTDVRPLEILFFLRDVRSLNYGESRRRGGCARRVPAGW
jgi:type I restriction enzyme, R subunit